MVGKFDRAWRRQRWLALCAVLILLAALPGTSLAQGSLTYGSTVTGSLTAETPFVIYAFQANAGDQITVIAVGVSPGMTPGISLLGPDQRQLAVSSGDPFGAEDGRTARISHRAASTGRYSLLISNTASTPGDFLLTLSGRPSEASASLAIDIPTTINIPPGAAPMLYSFTAPQNGLLTLTLSTSTPNFAFLARVYGPEGNLVAGLAGQALTTAALSVGPGNGFYEIAISALDPETQGTVQLLLTLGSAPASGGQPGVLPGSGLATPTPAVAAPVATSTPSVCQATSSVNVNVRGGPGTNYPAFGSLFAGTALNVVGRNSTSTWYVVDYNGRQGWVANSVVNVTGPCASLPFIADPPTPTPLPPTATPPSPTISFTVNGTTAVTINSGQCVTVAWSTANVQAVYYQNVGVTGTDSRQECPTTTTTYTLRVVQPDNSETNRTVTVNVGAAPPPVATLNYSLPPNYGSTSLTSGFVPDPHTVGITSGGSVDVSYLGGGCSGFATSAPDYSVNYTSGAFPTLRFYFIGSGDTTMVINAPNGNFYCIDDSFGTLNPTIDFNSPSGGRYDVWIGSYASGAFVSGSLYVTENTGNHP